MERSSEAYFELEAIEYFETISQRNTQNLICFAGGGHYDVYLPHTVKTLTIVRIYDILYTISSRNITRSSASII